MQELFDVLENSIQFDLGQLVIHDEGKLRSNIHKLARIAVFGNKEQVLWARFLIRSCANQLGIFPASIHDLYLTRGKGETPASWTAPAINLRALPFACARAAFRAARKIGSALMIFEIARVELGWAGISLGEYAACVLAAAIAEGYRGPLFLQGDHFQVSAQYPLEQEKKVIEQLIQRAIRAGFYNIDIDTSTLVDLSQPSVPQQQTVNATLSAQLAAFIRQLQPDGVTISVGGEIGEVGGHVSTVEELQAYISLFNQHYGRLCPGQPGLSKISIHSGSTHGGVVLPNGEIAKAAIDFNAIRQLGQAAQQEHGLGGVVQHGASTLALENFDRLVDAGTLEVHLATSFMTSFFQRLPAKLRREIHQWLDHQFAHQRTGELTDAQFYHQTQMHALAPFKETFWNLPADVLGEITSAWETQFDQLFNRLGCSNTRQMVESKIKPVAVAPTLNDEDAGEIQGVKGLAG